jgi:YjjG family noncanonical pyrimidine nucleotidase
VKRRYTNLLVDLDNTLLDFSACERIILESMARDFGFMPRTIAGEDLTAVYRSINTALWREYEKGDIPTDVLRVERFRRLIPHLDVTAAARPPEPWFLNHHYVDRLSRCAVPVPPANAVAAAIAPIIVITNGFAEVQRPRLDASGLSEYVSALFISEEVGTAKPASAFFDHVLAEIGNPDRSTCLVVGDSLTSDIAGGNAAGIDTVWFDRRDALGGGAAFGIDDHTPTYRITSLVQLKEIVCT